MTRLRNQRSDENTDVLTLKMTVQKNAEPLTPDPNSEAFYSGALDRISRFMLVLALALSAAAWWRYGWRMMLGFACGCAVAYLNFHWLKRVVTALGDRATQSGQTQSSAGVVLRFLLRYVLMGLGAYVIFTLSPASLYGLLAGLFLPVAAIACEAAYESWVALARGI
ncbi:MAG: ATP synthase subunit I [Terriglobales bacterium]